MSTSTIAGRFLLALSLSLVLAAPGARAQEEDTAWPREIDAPEAKIVIYQPQLESFDEVTLKARSAVSVTVTGAKEPVFGAAWFTGRVSIDRDANLVTLLDVAVTNARFPNASGADLEKFKSIVESEIPKWGLELSYDNLVADMAVVNREKAESEKLNNTPPEIIYARKPSVLVLIDGDPILRDVENTKLKYVINTPFFIVQDTVTGLFYLKGAEAWYSARDVMGPWTAMRSSPPDEVVTLAAQRVPQPPAEDAAAEAAQETEPAEREQPVIPEIIVRTTPAEVIQTSGDPDFATIEGTSLLYLKNSEDDVVMDIETQTYYVLIAGRWYASKSLDSKDWKFVSGAKLPADFAQIPAASDMGDVRANVPGTVEAEEAILDNQIPQTATVDRKTATVEVTYDGDPKFEAIPGTGMKYAVNTDKSVLLIDGKYYCCDAAVWFVASGAKGPWAVCTSVPGEVQDIPPESPVYNVKYVYIYDSTPDVVYVGYTPAYYGSYVYGGCVVYGTGYYYHPWYAHYYYPRPVTYGFSVHYNPYTGWGFSYGVSYGWFHVGVSTYGGYWGPGGYHYGYNHGYYHGYHHGYSHGYRHGYANGWSNGYRAGQAAGSGARPTPYKRDAYRTRETGVTPAKDRVTQRPSTQPAGRPNNVYADKNGNVYRQTDQGWQKNTRDGWKPTGSAKPSTKPATKPATQPATKPATKPGTQPATKPAPKPAARPATQPARAPSKDLQKSSQSRNRSSQRAQSRPARSGGGGRQR
jgi:hypothetical protein